jgi:hypothetical protein
MDVIISKTTVPLEQKKVSSSHKTLGCQKCIVSKEATQYITLREKSIYIINAVATGQFSAYQSWLAYMCLFIPSMT